MKYYLAILLGFCFLCLSAQSTYDILAVPSINLNKKLENGWKVNLNTAFRQRLKRGTFSEDQSWDYDYVHTDIALVLAKKIGLNSSIAGGYQLRIIEDEIANRLIQQYAIVSRFEHFRLGHRISADQTFREEAPAVFRFRYRLSIELPLNGLAVDQGEYYFKVSNEYLNSIRDENYDLECRLYPSLGYLFSDNNKLELGAEYRIDRFLNDNGRHRLFIFLNWYYAF